MTTTIRKSAVSAVLATRGDCIVLCLKRGEVSDLPEAKLRAILHGAAQELDARGFWLEPVEAILERLTGSETEFELFGHEVQPNARLVVGDRACSVRVCDDQGQPSSVEGPLPSWVRLVAREEAIYDEESELVLCRGLLETEQTHIEETFTLSPVELRWP